MNARDMEDIVMTSRETLRGWQEEYMRQYTQPLRDIAYRLTVQMLNRLPPEVRAQSQQRLPEAWKAVQDGMAKPV
jgi:hypothetical protein